MNNVGQLGIGPTTGAPFVGDDPGEMGDELVSVDLGDQFEPVMISCGLLHCCSLSTSSLIKCWGGNEYAQLGSVYKTFTFRLSPSILVFSLFARIQLVWDKMRSFFRIQTRRHGKQRR